MKAIQWILDFLGKNGFFANLKKYWFHQDEVRFLGYVVSAHTVRMKDEKIEVVKNWPESKLIKDIQVFFELANFYQHFI